MSTTREREAALRRALRTAADQVEPAPGGLERIQARLGRPRPLPVAWLEAAWTELAMRIPLILAAVARQARDVLWLVRDRFGPVPARGAGSRRLSWLRPLAAMTVAVFVLGAGAYIGLDRPALIFPTNSSSLGPPEQGASHSAGAGASGRRTTLGKGSRAAGSTAPAASPSSGCLRLYRSATPSPSGTPIQPPSPPPTPTPTPSTSGSPSPSPSASTSPSSTSSAPPTAGSSATTPAAGQLSGARNGAAQVTDARAASLTAKTSPARSRCRTGARKRRRHTSASPAVTGAALITGEPAGKVAAKLD